MRIVHAADLHLDSPLRGLARYDGAPADRIRGATRSALENLTQLCITERAELLLIAGDLYDGDWRDYTTGLFFRAQMSRLREAGVRVAMIRGNHDAASQITSHLRLPDNVRDLSTSEPETWLLEDLGVAVHGQGFPKREVTDDLAAGYPAAIPGVLNVGLLHTSMGGREGHQPYASTRTETLVAKGYDYWALGHVHAREVVCTEPWIVFPGNLQGRHIRETGAKGATVIEATEGRITDVTHRPLDVVRWARCIISVGPDDQMDDVLASTRARLEEATETAEGRLLCARMVLEGATALHEHLVSNRSSLEAELRVVANDVAPDEIWLEKTVLETHAPPDALPSASHVDLAGDLARSLEAIREDDDELAELLSPLRELATRLPTELTGPDGVLRLDDAEARRRIIDEALPLIMSRLLERGAAR